MGLVMTRMELLDRQGIDADELDAELREKRRAVRREIRVVRMKLALSDERRISRLDQDPFMALQLVQLELLLADCHYVVLDADEDAGPHQHFERQGIDPDAIVEEMLRRVDVRAGVRAK